MEINLHIHLPKELTAFLAAMSNSVAEVPKSEPTPEVKAPATRSRSKKAEAEPETQTSAEPVVATEETPAATPTSEPVATASTETKITLSTLKELILRLTADGKKAEIAEAIKGMGYSKGSEIPEDKAAEAYEILLKLKD